MCNVAIILILDKNKKIQYENEFLLCYQSIKKCFQYLLFYTVYVFCDCYDSLNERTKNVLNANNIILVKYQNQISNQYKYLTKIQCLNIFNTNYSKQYDYAIYMDLDVYWIKNFPLHLLTIQKNIFIKYPLLNDQFLYVNSKNQLCTTKYANTIIYDQYLRKRILNTMHIHKKISFNTFFEIFYLKNNLIEHLYSYAMQFLNKYTTYKSYYLEEEIYDNMYYNHKNFFMNSLILNFNQLNFKYMLHSHLTISKFNTLIRLIYK